MKTFPTILLGVLVCGCANPAMTDSVKSPPQQVSVTVHGPGAPLGLHWFRDSAERPMLYAEIYAQATEVVRTRARDLTPNSWGVILDIDETVLDNSEYQARLALSGQDYSPASWDTWVHDKQAVALPGAVAFVHAVRADFHGRIVLVTNRSQTACPDTEANLQAQSLEYDAILCAPNGANGRPVEDKNPRFARVRDGDVPALGKLDVIAYLGDNIQDFPDSSQAHPAAVAHFGKDFFLLPNPMYGSWVGNAYR